MVDPLLTLAGVSKRFGQVLVADRIDLTVGAGEAVGIVGPNGAGKTTLFAMISGDLRPDSGHVLLAGRRVTDVASSARCRLGLGRTYQVPRPFEHMTVFENVLVAVHQGGQLRGRAATGRAGAVLTDTGLLPLANTSAGRLTLLQRKRLEIARALGTGPRLLLLDEVAGGLTDPEVAELVGIVRRLNAGGLAVIWIEHVVHALTSTVDRLICLAGGAFVADGTPDEVLASAAVREVYLGGGLELVDTPAAPGGPPR
ncbi:MAG: branched-chain amino acid transport system ATP-binding protein [Micromonosporaceae bacterium]|jgi:branched-chain amino acid transport system ATP-binding protein|nr:branched-chain amino acid transport system ATP-binding protein [Micromonosporaceae bacterium]